MPIYENINFMGKYIVALDQGTTSSRAIIMDERANFVSMAQEEFRQIFPQPGLVEHDPMEIWQSQLGVLSRALAQKNIAPSDIHAIGITNQRETTIIWDKQSGKPIYNAIVWQDKRTAPICESLIEQGHEDYIRQHTGLVVDAYFSGTKIKWILDQVPGAREKAAKGELCFGTVDSWLVYNLTGRKLHLTDYTNASRTMLFNIRDKKWDSTICQALDIPMQMLPEVVASSDIYGYTDTNLFHAAIPIAGIAGDQQAALFGQNCTTPGMAKNTYGTGCFMLMNTGTDCNPSKAGLLTTMACGPSGEVNYAMEGSIFIAGAAIQWLRDGIKLVDAAVDSEYFATKVEDTAGVVMVPAFAGLGAPYWDMQARGAIFGLTRGTTKEHIIRATLDALAYQTRDVLQAMAQDTGIDVKKLRVDGGATANNYLMQFQADILGIDVERPAITETTALGAAFLAGIASGYWSSNDIQQVWKLSRTFVPTMPEQIRQKHYNNWTKAVNRTLGWLKD